MASEERMSSFGISKFDIKHLRTFATVVEHEGVMAAAHQTGASLSTISRDLTALEKRLGLQLCRRGRAGFALTPQGEEVYHATVDLLSRIRVFEQKIGAAKRSVGGRFNVGLIDNVVGNHRCGVIAALSKMNNDFPDLTVNVSIHSDSSIDVMVRDRRIDIGVTGQPAWLPSLQYVPAFIEEHRLYVSRNAPCFAQVMEAFNGRSDAPTDLVPYVARSFKTEAFQEFEEHHPLHVAGRGATLESILAAVLAGVGCAIMPVHLIQPAGQDSLVEVPFEGSPFVVQLYLAFRRDAADQPTMRAFMDRFPRNPEATGSCDFPQA